jgi:hypothetical protein
MAVTVTAAQGSLAQLGLTEAAARNFLLTEATSLGTGRRAAIVETGRRAFYKLPPAARGPAATALFAWAKAYVGSAAFKTAYAQHRRDVLGPGAPAAGPSVDEQVQEKLAELRASFVESRKMAASLPPATATEVLKKLAEQEARLDNGEWEKMLRAGLQMESAARAAGDAESARANDERYPADPSRIFVRRLREFLDATADVNFSARTLRLTGGVDGIEFVDKVDRQRNWIWQEAVIVGPEATAAARSAAAAWLRELQP